MSAAEIMAAHYVAELGREIERRRKALGLTQANLGDLVHADSGTVSRWERGVNEPRDLEALASALQTDVRTLFAGIKPPNARVARKVNPELLALVEDDDRLARMEAKLDDLVRLLKGPASDAPQAPAGELGRDLADGPPSPESRPRTARHRARGS